MFDQNGHHNNNYYIFVPTCRAAKPDLDFQLHIVCFLLPSSFSKPPLSIKMVYRGTYIKIGFSQLTDRVSLASL